MGDIDILVFVFDSRIILKMELYYILINMTQDSNSLFNNKIHGNIQRRWDSMWNNCCITWYDKDVLIIHLNINSPYDWDMLGDSH